MLKTIMFHQFNSKEFYNCKGSITKNQFYDFCLKLSKEFEIIGPNEIGEKLNNKCVLLYGIKLLYFVSNKEINL